MTRDIYDIAKETAAMVLSTAQCAGYEVTPERDLFLRSDIGRLEEDIVWWIEKHMRVVKA